MKKIIIIGIVLGGLWHSNLMAQGIAQVPYYMNFEDFEYNTDIIELENWTTEHDVLMGAREIINVDNSHWPGADAYEGKSILMIWSYISGSGYIRQDIVDATLKIDLSGNDDFFLQGAWKGVFHEVGYINCFSPEGLPRNCAFIEGDNEESEGIFISDDGGDSYVKIMGFSGVNNWEEFKLNLSLLSSQYGFDLNTENRIKFQYYCVYGNEGFNGSIMRYLFIDDIYVYKLPGYSGGRDDGHYLKYLYDKAGNRTSVNIHEVILKSGSNTNIDENEPLADDLFGAREIKIYPNPTKGDLNILIQNGEKDETYQYQLFDLSGRKLMEFTYTGNGMVPLNLHSFNSGTYILVVRTSDGDLKYKILKE